MTDTEIKQAALLIKKSKRTVAFTGAGISVESGIPPFRGEGGLWNKFNPEVIQLFFFFLAINSILRNNIYLKTAALFFLSIVSYRGMMLCGGVFLFDVLRLLWLNKKPLLLIFNIKFILAYIIGAVP
jgi:hypothetical protein